MGDTETREAFIAGLRELADLYEQQPELLPPYTPDLAVICTDPATFAQQVKALGGQREKSGNDKLMRVSRSFGPLAFEVVIHRDVACTRRVVGVETVVEAAVACVHCGAPIVRHDHEDGGHTWWHVGDGEYRYCQTSIDDDGNEIGGRPATPPDFTSATEREVEIVEWDCDPILAGAAEVTA